MPDRLGTDGAISVPDLRVEERFPRFTPRALASGLSAVFTFPLRHGVPQLGALDLYRDVAGPLSSASMTTAQTLADVAAAYLINAQARSDLQDSSEQSREAALHDPLTGLPNRVLMLHLLEHAVRVGRRSGKTSALFFVDLDDFKAVDDTYGHRVGDELLVAVSERLTGLLRPGDSLARLSGDEFVILCEGLAEPSWAEPFAGRIQAALSRLFVLGTVQLTISASIGIAFSGPGSEAPDELLHEADLAMYRAKRDRVPGRSALDLGELHLAGHLAGLARSLPGALGRGELSIAYQPIVDSVDGRLMGVEALLRWTHPSRDGSVPPAVFIPFAEQSGQIIELGRWVLAQAWLDRRRLRPARPPIAMSVNVSANEVMSAGFAAVLDSVSADPGLLTLEVTESVFVRDERRALLVLSELKEIGVKLSLDDFGTGYSTLGYVDKLPIDTIKIDHAIVAAVGESRSGQAIVTSIIGLAHDLGLTVVAEGVALFEQQPDGRSPYLPAPTSAAGTKG